VSEPIREESKDDRDVCWKIERRVEADAAFEVMSDQEVADQLEAWAKPFDAMMRPGFKHDRAELLRETARRLRKTSDTERQLDLWSSRAQAAAEDVGAITEELERIREENRRLHRVRLHLRSALLTIAHARDASGLHFHELLKGEREQHVLEAIEATKDP
jgi:hypothetical protein